MGQERKRYDETGKDATVANEAMGDSSKNFTVDDVKQPDERDVWIKGEKNPDHKLMEIHAANSGFKAKMNARVGSYLISQFTKKMLNNQGPNGKYICEVMDEIQRELADKGKQQIVPIFHDKTRYVTLERNDGQHLESEEVQMLQMSEAVHLVQTVIEEEEEKVEEKVKVDSAPLQSAETVAQSEIVGECDNAPEL